MAATIHHTENTIPPNAISPTTISPTTISPNAIPQGAETTTTEARKSVRVVTLPARFDAFADVDLAMDERSNVVVDGRFVQFADLPALQSLVDARLDALRQGSELLIGAPSAAFEAIVDLTGFGDLLNMLAPAPEITNLPISTTDKVALSGDLGPQEAHSLRQELAGMLEQPRPKIEIDLVDVASIHLGVVNVVVAAQGQARSNLGDVIVIARPGTPAQQLFLQVGIVPVMRP